MDELAYLTKRRINESFALLSIDRILVMLIFSVSLTRSLFPFIGYVIRSDTIRCASNHALYKHSKIQIVEIKYRFMRAPN